ncbi:caspase family protein, partial [Catellatospora paridis]
MTQLDPHRDARRYFIGTATATYRPETGLEDRPELEQELTAARRLFANMGYTVAPGFDGGMAVREFQDRLREFFISPERRASDIIVVYYTGHGLNLDDGLLLPMADTTADLDYTSLRAADLPDRILRTHSRDATVGQQVLFVLDVCYAGSASAGMAVGMIRFADRLRGLAVAPSIAVIVSARDYEQAEAGAFTNALAAAMDDRSVAGYEVPFLPLEPLTAAVSAGLPAHQHPRVSFVGERTGGFFPNPRYDRWHVEFDLRTHDLRQVRQAREQDRRGHVASRAQGLDRPDDREDMWFFTGRHQALREISAWLTGAGEQTLIVTGRPGSGKSALLSRLDVLTDHRRRARVPELHRVPADTIPPAGSVSRFIHARGLTPQDLLVGLAEACGIDDLSGLVSPGKLLDRLRTIAGPVTVIVDALDEAVDRPEDHGGESSLMVEQVLAPLIRAGRRSPLRLLVGTRAHLVDALGGPSQRIDLDNSAYADRPSIRTYARACLTRLIDTSPYRAQPAAYLDAMADAIAEAAGDSFLIALITARSLALREKVVASPFDAAWRAGLPRHAAGAMRQDLDERLTDRADRARHLLVPLAYAESSGLPWEDLWPALVREITGEPCTNADLDWLVEQAGYYIIETSLDSRSAYRLYHDSLAEHLREGRDHEADQASIVGVLSRRVPRRADGTTDWRQADPYTNATIAIHAAAGHMLDSLVVQPLFLLGTAPAALQAALPHTRTADGQAAADAYRRASTRIRTSPPHVHAAYLQLAARCARAPHLAEAINGSDIPLAWGTDWASWRLQPPHHTLNGHASDVGSVALGQVDGRHIVVSGADDATIRVWDATTGEPIMSPITGHTGPVRAVAFGHVHGLPVIVSGSHDSTVRVWDAATGAPVGGPFTGHGNWVRSVALGQVGGRPVVVSGGDDSTVRIWDVTTGELATGVLAGHSGWIWSVALGQVDSRPVVVSGSSDTTVRVWDATTGSLAAGPFTGHKGWVRSVAIGQVDGRSVVISGGSDDTTVRVWDATTGEPAMGPITGHTDDIHSVAFGHLDGRPVILSGGSDTTVRVWDAATGEPTMDPITGHTDAIHSVAFGHLDGRPVILSGGSDTTVRVWDASAGAQLADPFNGHTDGIRSVAFGSVDGRAVVVSAGDATVRVWDAKTGEAVMDPIAGHTGQVYAVAFGNLDGRPIIVSGGRDGTLRVCDAADGKSLIDPVVGHTEAVVAIAIGHIDDRVVIVSAGGVTIRIWDAADGKPVIDPIIGHTETVAAVAFGQINGRPVVVSASGQAIHLWDATNGEPVAGPFSGHAGHVLAVAFGHIDGRPVIVSGSDDETVGVWDATSGEPLADRFTGHRDWVRSVAFAQVDGRHVVYSGSDDTTVRAWDATTGEPIMDPIIGHHDEVNAIAVGHVDGHPVVVSGSDDATVGVWDAITGTPIADRFTGHSEWVRSVTFGDADGQLFVASGSDDATIRVWDASTGTPIAGPFIAKSGNVSALACGRVEGGSVVFAANGAEVLAWNATTGKHFLAPLTGHTDAIMALAFGHINDQPVIISGSNDTTIRVWDATTGDPVITPITGHTDAVNAVAFGHINDQPVIISGSNDTT